MVNYHESQLAVLKRKESNELVSASAGSGKTTVMIQKITDLLVSGSVKADQIMVVTFTIAAAEEMKTRLLENINACIKQNPKLVQQLNQIKEDLTTASIGTIHSICLRTIKKYFYALDLNANVSVVEGAQLANLKSQAFNQAIQATSQQDLLDLIEVFSDNKRDYSILNECVNDLYQYLTTIPDRQQYFERSISNYQDSTLAQDIVLAKLKEQVCFCYSKMASYQFTNDKLSSMQTEVSDLLMQAEEQKDLLKV